MKLYAFNVETGEYTEERTAQKRPNGDFITDVIGATAQKPPVTGDKQVAVWTGSAWVVMDDHRQTRDKGGVIEEDSGTPYWLPGDTWQTPARYLEKPGPLPKNAILIKPEKDLNTLKSEKKSEITRAQESATVATLTMPAEHPSASRLAVDAALFAAEDSEGLAYVTEALAARSEELQAQVDACTSAAEIDAIVVEFPV